LLGGFAARRLLYDGHHVRLLVRDAERARRDLGADFEYATGSVTDEGAVDRALRGADFVHVSLGVEDPRRLDAVEHRGTARVARAAHRHGLRRITYITGSLVREDYGQKIPEHRAKLAAERAIESSGVPFTFFRPTYVTDTLPRHVQGRLAVLFGRQRSLLHPIAAKDIARMVARSLGLADDENRDLHLQGPEPMTLAEALRLYVGLVEPGVRVLSVPIPVMSLVDRSFLGRRLEPAIAIMSLLRRLGERGDPRPANDLLGAPDTTVRAWCEARAGVGS
jgi:uncharacterized protein YbjT (DUF2867 family)